MYPSNKDLQFCGKKICLYMNLCMSNRNSTLVILVDFDSTACEGADDGDGPRKQEKNS